MLILTGATDIVQVVTGSAVTIDVHASWVDNAAGTITPGRTNTAISTAATTTVVGSPSSAQRTVQALSVRNKHASTACAVTVQHYDGTITVELVKVTLAAGERLEYEDASGWSVLDAAGNFKSGLTPSVGLLRGIINVLDYGAKGDGATDDRTAIQAAINAGGAGGVSARGVDVWFPPGVYAITGVLTCPFNNVILRGAGWQSTVLYASHTTGDILQLGDGTTHGGCGLTDMSVWCSAARTTGASINVNLMNDCIIRNFVINNCFQGVLVQGTSLKVWIQQGEINNIHVTDGVGIQVTNGLGGDTYIDNIVISNNPASKPLAGIQITQTGHASILRCNITSCGIGLSVNPGASQDVNYLFVDHSLFDSGGTHAAKFAPTNATGRIRSVVCGNSWFSGCLAAGYGIEIGGVASSTVDDISFVGCRVLNNYQHGIGITYASVNNTSFSECTIAGNGQNTINTYDGVNIAASVNNVSVLNCAICQAGTAGNQQRYAINVAAGTSSGLMFVNNQTAPNGTLGNNGYINLGAITGGGNLVDSNSPAMASAYSSASLTASAGLNTVHTIISDTTAYRNRLVANSLRIGTTIRFTNATTFRVLMGTNNTTGDTAVLTAAVTSAAGGTGIPFRVVIELTCRGALGATCAWYGYMWVYNVGTTGIYTLYTFGIAGTMATIASTSALYVNLSHQTAAATTTNTFQVVTMEVVVP
jgi:hypothetical protein